MAIAPRCVVIDDDPDYLALVHHFLAKISPSLEVIEFASSVEALDFLLRRHVDLIITDFRMPFVDGLRLASAIREVNHDVPIVMMSGDEMESQAMASGVSAFLRKTSLPGQLGTVLRRLGLPLAE